MQDTAPSARGPALWCRPQHRFFRIRIQLHTNFTNLKQSSRNNTLLGLGARPFQNVGGTHIGPCKCGQNAGRSTISFFQSDQNAGHSAIPLGEHRPGQCLRNPGEQNRALVQARAPFPQDPQRAWPRLAPGLAWPRLVWPGLAAPGLAWPRLAWNIAAFPRFWRHWPRKCVTLPR